MNQKKILCNFTYYLEASYEEEIFPSKFSLAYSENNVQ